MTTGLYFELVALCDKNACASNGCLADAAVSCLNQNARISHKDAFALFCGL